MDQKLYALPPALTSGMARIYMSLLNSLRVLIAVNERPYRPEKYYMRGPEPKWREKHARRGREELAILKHQRSDWQRTA